MEMTIDQFIEKERLIWSDDYIFALLDNGYTPVYTDRGWKWLAPISMEPARITGSRG